MAARGSAANRSEAFGRLLSGMVSSIAYYEGKTSAVVEEDLGAALTVAGKTIQHYKAGYLPPTDEAVHLLAEAAVRRGFLGREWLQRFLHAARYPSAEKLLDELCPAPQLRPRRPRVYENLPAPTYSQFVMRAQAFAEVADGLSKRTAVVLIVGLGGNSKTSLAREVAAHCLRDDNDATSHFDAVVWTSDKGAYAAQRSGEERSARLGSRSPDAAEPGTQPRRRAGSARLAEHLRRWPRRCHAR